MSETSRTAPIVEENECVDWDSDDEGVQCANLHYEDDAVHVEYEFEDVDLDLHSNGEDEILLVGNDDSTEYWRSVSVTIDADEAELLAEQLKVAAKHSREGDRADVRL